MPEASGVWLIHRYPHAAEALYVREASLQRGSAIAQAQLVAKLRGIVSATGSHGASRSTTSSFETNRSAPRNSGNSHAQNPITINVPAPPITTAGTVPNHCAVSPDSNCPNSFDVPMNSEFTALTRPRMESGVDNCTSVPRIITLTMSDAPTNSSAIKDTMRLRESPNAMVNTPNPATLHNMVMPACLRRGRWASSIAM